MSSPASHAPRDSPVPRGTAGSTEARGGERGQTVELSLVETAPSAPDPEVSQSRLPGRLHMVLVEDIRPNPVQPRKTVSEEALDELALSIAQVGLLQPLVCRRRSGGESASEWELVAGERRWRACRLAGLTQVPVVEFCHDDGDEALLLAAAVVENLQRQDLNPVELALAYQQLTDAGLSSQEVGRLVGRSGDHVRAHLGVLRLSDRIQSSLMAGVLTLGHVRPLCALDNHQDAEAVAARAVRESLTVRQVEEIVASSSFPKSGHSQRKRARPPERRFLELEEALESALETRVRVEGSRRGGWIKIVFADEEDLARLRSLVTPPSSA